MSLSECGGVCSSALTSDDCHSLSAGVVLYADMRGEVGGDKGIMKFPSTIGTSVAENYAVKIELTMWLAPLLSSVTVSMKQPLPWIDAYLDLWRQEQTRHRRLDLG